jgi:hypothetical protein
MIGDKYLLGNTQLTLADLTCYPGTINMEFILPRVFGWPQDLFTTQVPETGQVVGPLDIIASLCRHTSEHSRHLDICVGRW